MTSFVRTSFAFLLLAITAACGGGDDAVTVVDAAPDAAIDAPTDAPPLVCNPPTMNCGGQCVNTTNDPMFCGNCTTVCNGGRICSTSQCMCPNVTVPTSVSGGGGTFAGVFQGVLFGSSTFSGDALVAVADPMNTMLNQDYVLSEATLGQLPTVGFAVNLMIANPPTADATFAATEGTLRITSLCEGSGGFPPNGRISGTLTNVKFSAVDGLLSGNPVITPGGCTLPPTGTIPSITFTFGDPNCTPAAQ